MTVTVIVTMSDGDRMGDGDRRCGNKDREACITHLNEAHAQGYLNEDMWQSRTDKATAAEFFRDLSVLTGDVPSVAELSGKTVVAKKKSSRAPSRLRGFAAACRKDGRCADINLLYGPLTVFSLLTAIIPPIYILQSPDPHLGLSPGREALGVLFILLGIAGVAGFAIAWGNTANTRYRTWNRQHRGF
jgi:hypothetical protein